VRQGEGIMRPITPCEECYCMTKTIKGKCGKCGAKKKRFKAVRKRGKIRLDTYDSRD